MVKAGGLSAFDAKEYGDLAALVERSHFVRPTCWPMRGALHFRAFKKTRLGRQRVEFLLGRGTAMAFWHWSVGLVGGYGLSQGDDAYHKDSSAA